MDKESPNGTGRRTELYRQAIAADIALLRQTLSETGLLKAIRSRPEASIRNIMITSAAAGFLLGALRHRAQKRRHREQIEQILEILSHPKTESGLRSRLARVLQGISDSIHAACKEAESHRDE